jgi:hypothetical protein
MSDPPLEECFNSSFELWRELVYSGPAFANASKLRDGLLELEDILRILDRCLASYEHPSTLLATEML